MSIYDMVGALNPGRSAFDLSHSKTFDADLGRLIPILCEDVIPGDVWHLQNANIVRAQPLVVPVYHKLDLYCHYFFVPYRILWKDWQKFITGGVNGDSNISLPTFLENGEFEHSIDIKRYSLWDYFGFPIFQDWSAPAPSDLMLLDDPPNGINDFLWRAYWAIWRDYYRDSNHQINYPNTVIPVGQDDDEMLANLQILMEQDTSLLGTVPACNIVAYRCWQKDYFTSALPWQQRGTSPAIPIQGTSTAVWDVNHFLSTTGGPAENIIPVYTNKGGGSPAPDDMWIPNDTATGAGAGEGAKNMQRLFNANTINFTTSGTDIADLRYAVQIQKWMERNARGGYRYNEFLKAHFGTSPSDERLQRPEYIGGSRQPVIISEVLQTSATVTGSPQGNYAGHGMSVSQAFTGKYRVKEHGIIMGIMSIMPEAIYQQGIPRQWMKQTRFDYYSPEFAHLSEQEIRKSEIYWLNNPDLDNVRFGFQGAFDEYRTRQSIVCGKIATSLDDWTLSRIFDTTPVLNESFLTLEELSKNRRDAWAVPGVVNNEQGQFLVQWRNIIKAIRPMPYIPEPGLLDHF